MPGPTLSRRQFCQKLVVGTTGFCTLLNTPAFLFPTAKPGRIILARHASLKRLNQSPIKEKIIPFLNQALQRLTGLSSATAAWKSLFSPTETVGIKLSCLPGPALSSSYGLVLAIVDGLQTCGIKPDNIIIWERTNRELTRAGFPIHLSGPITRGSDSFAGDGYLDDFQFSYSIGTRFSQIMPRLDAIINVPVLKDHDLSGVSISMKNFYGAIYNPNKFHKNNCNPYVAELNAHPFIKEKLRLIVCDASRIQINNGPAFFPGYALEYGALLVGRDPVALDYLGWQIIEKERLARQLPTLKDAGREPQYILTAEKLNLGTSHHECITL